MKFLYYVFAYNKNFEREDDPNDDESDDAEDTYRTFTYDILFSMIENYCDSKESVEQRIVAVAKWKLRMTGNILSSLLKHRYDMHAAEHGKVYMDHMNQ